VPERRAGRERGKSDPIDALAIARAALREPGLARPRPGEQVFRDLKLLVDHRDDLVDERRRAQQRLRWHLHQLDPTFVVPAKALDRPAHLERVSRWLSRQEQELQVRLGRELVARCRSFNRIIVELDHELEQRAAELAPALLELPGCGAVPAAKLLAEIGPIDRFKSDAQLARHGGVAPLEASQAAYNDTGSTAAATASSTPRSTGSRSHNRATTPAHVPTSNANKQKARAAGKRSAA
jgi:transposase